MDLVVNSTHFLGDKLKEKRQPVGIASLFIIIAIFSRELGKREFYGIDFDWISYPFYVLYFLFLVLTSKLSFDKYLLVLFGVLLIGSVYAKGILGLSLIPFLKQFTPIVIIYTVVSYHLRKYKITKLFDLYVKFAVLSAILGLIQIVLKLYGILFLTDYSWYNIDSIAEEPSHYAAILLPALIYCLQKFKEYKREFFLLFIVLVFTFNLTAYVVFAAMCLIVFRKIHYLILVFPLVIFLAKYIYGNDPLIKFRIDESIKIIKSKDIRDTHGTPLSFFSNLQVAWHNLIKNPISGAGLGGHEEMYYKYYKSNPFSQFSFLLGLNAKSAHSLIIRIISELGLVGLLLFIYVILRIFLMPISSDFYIIGLACLSHFLCKFLKLGNYFDLGTPFFFLSALYSYKRYFYEKYFLNNRILYKLNNKH